MNGIEFLEAVRTKFPELPFILFTGKGTEEVASDAISKGATDYLKKELDTDQYTLLANRVRNAIEAAAMRRQGDRHLKAIETAQEGISILNDVGRFSFVNEAYADLYGYDPEELLGERWDLLYPKAEIQFVRDEVLPAVEAHGSWHGYTTGVKADGSTFTEDHALSKTAEGDLICTVSKADESAEYNKTLRKYETLVQGMDDQVFLLDENLVCTFVNDAAVENSPYSFDDLVGTNPKDLVDNEIVADPQQVERCESLLTQIIDGERETATQKITLSLPEGNRVTSVRMSGVESQAGEVIGAVLVARNVTDRERHRQKLEARTEAIEAAKEGIAILDETGEYRYVNRAHASTYGYDSSDPFIGNTWEICYEAEEATRLEEEVIPIVNETGDWRGEVVGMRQDGSTFPQELSLTHLSDGGLICVVRDITEQKEHEQQLQETNQQLEAVLNTVDAAIFIKDTEHRYKLMNEECRRLLGVASGEELDGQTDHDFFPADVANQLQADDQRVLDTEQSIRVEEEILTPNGTQTNLTIKSPVYDDGGELSGLCAVSTDITERKRQEKKLERKNVRLDNFASVVSHDLRNPLNLAQGRLELVEQECDSVHLDQIGDALERMGRIIDDVLWLAREGKDIGSTVSVDLRESVDAAWQVVANKDAAAELVYHSPEDDHQYLIKADPDRFRQMLENLFRNAIEHGGPDVTVHTTPIVDGFAVADDGPGIPPDERDRIFEAGYSSADRGTGLGLHIVKQVADAHGWNIDVTESSTDGTRFEITGVTRPKH